MKENKSIIIFDGDCNLCNSTVRFIIKKDKKFRFLFAASKSSSAQQLLTEYKLSQASLDNVVLIQNNKAYVKSTAILKIMRELDGAIKLLYFLKLIPTIIRDFFYRIISKYRYSLFGKNNTCNLHDVIFYSEERFLS